MTQEDAVTRLGRTTSISALDRISSRMLERYLLDIEQLAHTDSEAALEAAASLPAIATALENETTRTSYERCRAWCEEWLDSPQARADSKAALSKVWCAENAADEAGSTEIVPVNALRELRLRRHARPTPTRARPMGAPEHLHVALIQAAHRWYDTQAGGSARVQRNLARLAVLR